jgi:hypothetical protein
MEPVHDRHQIPAQGTISKCTISVHFFYSLKLFNNDPLRRYPRPSSLNVRLVRTYFSGLLGALHLAISEQLRNMTQRGKEIERADSPSH